MIHPSTEVRLVDPVIGLGVFATEPIPRGTIVYVQDPWEIEIDAETYGALSPALQGPIERYSYIDPRGMRIVSWDHGKYVNHRCDANSLSTGYGFEIAVRDIRAGEEITDDYGLFNLPCEMEVACGCRNCRGVVRASDAFALVPGWDRRVRRALRAFPEVAQPLGEILDGAVQGEVSAFLAGRARYRSVGTLLRSEPRPARPRSRARRADEAQEWLPNAG